MKVEQREARVAANGRGTMLSVQVMRGLAAISVVLFHTNVILAQPEYGGHQVFTAVASKGWLGVNFFFVLSGFIILYAHADDLGNRARIPRYLWRRFTRVYPLYWLALTAFIAAGTFGLGHMEMSWEAPHLISAYTLVQVANSPVLALKVAWTLLFEVKFYLMFLLFFLSRRLGIAVFSVWFVAIIVRNMFRPLPDWGQLLPDWGLLNIWCLYFLCGMIACWTLWRADARFGVATLAVGLLMLAVTSAFSVDMLSTVYDPLLMIAFAATFSVILVGGVLCERRFSWRPPAALLLLGDASYAIYLIHSAVISLLAQIQAKVLPQTQQHHAIFIAVFLSAVVAGLACHVIVERPILTSLRRIRFTRRAVMASGTA
jgi:peptidoglycan/LPS O-acetylase OafA/YrhL